MTSKLQSFSAVRPAASVAVHRTLWEPIGNKVPDDGVQSTVGGTPLESVAVGYVQVTTAVALLIAAVSYTADGGQVFSHSTGLSASTTKVGVQFFLRTFIDKTKGWSD